MSASNYTSERTIRAMIFRREAKAGIGEIMTYLRARKAIKDPMFWPPRPVLSFIGVKNVLGRLRADLDTLEMFYGRKTSHLISILDQILDQVYLLRFENPPTQLRGSLGADLVSIYVALSKPNSLNSWPDTCADIEFHFLQTRDVLASRRSQIKFDRQANIPYTRAGDCDGVVEAGNLFCFLLRPNSHAKVHLYRKLQFG